MPFKQIVERNYDLTAKNPNRKEENKLRAPGKITASILEKEREILTIVETLHAMLVGRGKGRRHSHEKKH
ncbi:MAG: hypothetical protein KAV83_10790 [Desulfobacterales bacterium]|nr:hypothetical protein [Desulfobacterales bacterium]